MAYIFICDVCEQSFNSITRKAKYCSVKCNRKAYYSRAKRAGGVRWEKMRMNGRAFWHRHKNDPGFRELHMERLKKYHAKINSDPKKRAQVLSKNRQNMAAKMKAKLLKELKEITPKLLEKTC